jgi:hypothetical protein
MKIIAITTLSLIFLLLDLLSFPAQIFPAGGLVTVQGELTWDEYGDINYGITTAAGKHCAVKIMDKDSSNKSRAIHQFVGKTVVISAPLKIIRERTEYHNLQYLDLTGPRATIRLP